MIVVGVIGKIGSGKTAVLNYLKDQGFAVFNSDEKVAELYKTPEVDKKLRELFDAGDKQDIKKIIIENIKKNNGALHKVESIIHPLIEEEIKVFLEKKHNKPAFLEVPLLYESGMDKYCDKVIMLEVDDGERKKRLKEKSNNDIINLLEERQIDPLAKRKKVDYILKNNESMNSLICGLEEILIKEKIR